MATYSVTIEPTSRDTIIKFVTNSFLTQTQSFEFNNIDETVASPLAKELFYLPFVKTVYISQNFIAIERFNLVAWSDVQNEVAQQIENYLNAGNPVIQDPETPKNVPVSVYAEVTPNPSVMKFVANKALVNDMYEFKQVGDTRFAPLARALFKLPFVKEVFMSENYISVTKLDGIEWEEISGELREFLRIYIADGKRILDDEILEHYQGPSTVINESNSATIGAVDHQGISKEIVDILDEYIKPAVAGDGGNIAFESYNEETKTVKVILQGACSGCPSSTVTLKNGIETMLREMLQGKVEYVEAVNG